MPADVLVAYQRVGKYNLSLQIVLLVILAAPAVFRANNDLYDLYCLLGSLIFLGPPENDPDDVVDDDFVYLRQILWALASVFRQVVAERLELVILQAEEYFFEQ